MAPLPPPAAAASRRARIASLTSNCPYCRSAPERYGAVRRFKARNIIAATFHPIGDAVSFCHSGWMKGSRLVRIAPDRKGPHRTVDAGGTPSGSALDINPAPDGDQSSRITPSPALACRKRTLSPSVKTR